MSGEGTFDDDEVAVENAEPRGHPKHLALSDLTADNLYDEVIVRVQVVGCKDLKAVAEEITLESEESGKRVRLPMRGNPDLLVAVLTGQDKLASKLMRESWPRDDHTRYRVVYDGMMDFSVLFVRDLNDGTKFTSRKATVREVFLVGQLVPASNKLELRGTVVLNPKTKDITFIAFEARPLVSQFENFVPSEAQKAGFVEHFHQRCDAHLQLAPHIVGDRRERAKLWASLVHHSPYEVPNIHGRSIRGCIRVAFIGDSRTGKSEIAIEGTDEPRASFSQMFGEKVSVETSSRTGILYTIDADRDVLKWGVLPMNDRGYVTLDGLQKMQSEEMAEYREALSTERIKVDRSQRGEAPIRVRQIACLNPHKPLASYLFPCQAILDSNTFTDPVDVTRWDMFIPFSQQDVPVEEIVASGAQGKPMADAVYHDHVLWAWSRLPEHIVYREEAKDAIRKLATELFRRYSVTSLPLVHNEVREVLTRVAVAFASLRHSTDDGHEKVIVTADHVRAAYELMAASLNDLALDKYKEHEAGRSKLEDDEYIHMVVEFNWDHIHTLDSLRTGMKNSFELSEQLKISVSTVKRVYETLSHYGLIEGTSKGVRLTEKGHALVKRLMTESVTVPKSDTMTPQDVSLLLEVHRRVDSVLDGRTLSIKQVGDLLMDRFGGNREWAISYFLQRCRTEELPFKVQNDKVTRLSNQEALTRWM